MKAQIKALLAYLFLIAPSAHASDFQVEGDNLQPTPIPVEAAIRQWDASKRYAACKLIGAAADLGGTGKTADWIVTNAEGCGWQVYGSVIWIVYQHKASGYVVVLFAEGVEVKMSEPKSYGLRQLTVSGLEAVFSATEPTWRPQDVFSYDGTQYVRIGGTTLLQKFEHQAELSGADLVAEMMAGIADCEVMFPDFKEQAAVPMAKLKSNKDFQEIWRSPEFPRLMREAIPVIRKEQEGNPLTTFCRNSLIGLQQLVLRPDFK